MIRIGKNTKGKKDKGDIGWGKGQGFDEPLYTRSDSEYKEMHDRFYNGETGDRESIAGKDKKQELLRKGAHIVMGGALFGLSAAIAFTFAINCLPVENNQGSNRNLLPAMEENSESDTTPGDKAMKADQQTGDRAAINRAAINVVDIVDIASPSVVAVVSKKLQDEAGVQEESIYDNSTYRETEGSGIIIRQTDNEVIIITNYHVIANGANIEVTFPDGMTAEALMKGSDADRDIAVIAVPNSSLVEETLSIIHPAKMGDSDSTRVGETVIAIGNALGYGQSVTVGVVSALNREIAVADSESGITKAASGSYIQTDAAVNPGNSGGALLNSEGLVIGINSNKIIGDATDGMAYAIPISSVADIIETLSGKESRAWVAEGKRGFLGISGQDVSEEAVKVYGMPAGVYVAEAMKGGAAEKAGIKKGDIITKAGDNIINSMADLQWTLQYYSAKEDITLDLQRLTTIGYAADTVIVTLGSANIAE